MPILCFAFLVRTTTKSIQFINRPVFLFLFFHVVVLLLLTKQQQQKIINSYTISACYAWALVKIHAISQGFITGSYQEIFQIQITTKSF
jgi:membrane-associated HD superfamily phosphohydrolase